VVVHGKTLEGIIVEEVTKKMMTTEIVIARDLKSAKSFDGTDVKQLLGFPISEFLKVNSRSVKSRSLHDTSSGT